MRPAFMRIIIVLFWGLPLFVVLLASLIDPGMGRGGQEAAESLELFWKGALGLIYVFSLFVPPRLVKSGFPYYVLLVVRAIPAIFLWLSTFALVRDQGTMALILPGMIPNGFSLLAVWELIAEHRSRISNRK